MKRIIDSTLVILYLMLIFGCKESKVGQSRLFWGEVHSHILKDHRGLKHTTHSIAAKRHLHPRVWETEGCG